MVESSGSRTLRPGAECSQASASEGDEIQFGDAISLGTRATVEPNGQIQMWPWKQLEGPPRMTQGRPGTPQVTLRILNSRLIAIVHSR
jgi:hypothetical protein